MKYENFKVRWKLQYVSEIFIGDLSENKNLEISVTPFLHLLLLECKNNLIPMELEQKEIVQIFLTLRAIRHLSFMRETLKFPSCFVAFFLTLELFF